MARSANDSAGNNTGSVRLVPTSPSRYAKIGRFEYFVARHLTSRYDSMTIFFMVIRRAGVQEPASLNHGRHVRITLFTRDGMARVPRNSVTRPL